MIRDTVISKIKKNMTQEIVKKTNSNLATIDLEKEFNRAKSYIKDSLAPNTIRAYESQSQIFEEWCFLRNLSSLPADLETISVFLSWYADQGKKYSTIARMIFSISQKHRVNGYESPNKSEKIRRTLAGIRRNIGTIQDRVDPLTSDDIKKICNNFDNTAIGLRDKAIVLVGWTGAFRRSEIVGLVKNDIEFVDDGMRILVRNSKTDKKKEGFIKPIFSQKDDRYCPVLALKDWMIISNQIQPKTSKLFYHLEGDSINTKLGDKINDKMIARMLKKFCDNAGINGWYSGHSLRAGFITQSAINGKSDRSIMKVSGHRSPAMIARYVRIADEFTENASEDILK